jgi:uncharacterized protein YjbJ (UPF0337 family)
MNKDQAKGTLDEMVGAAKQKAGKLTGNTELRVEGAVQQVKGKLETAWGKTKEAVHDATKVTADQHDAGVQVTLGASATLSTKGPKK